jgi:hypothetical protein
MVGVREAEIPLLAELHRAVAVQIVGVYDPDPEALGHEIAEILGIPHGSTPEFLGELAKAGQVVLSQERERIQDAVSYLRAERVRLLGLHEALELYGEPGWPPRRGVREVRAESARWRDFDDAIRWLDRALDREEVLRGLLALVIQAVDADSGSIQLLNHATKELYVAYGEGLSDHTIRSSRRRLGEGISGRVALSGEGELIEGQPTDPKERDRSDIKSAICVPLLDDDLTLGVTSVSRDRGSSSFSEGDLATVQRMAARITPVLSHLLEIQSYHERALVNDLERGLDRLLQMELSVSQSFGLIRSLLHDLSGAESCQLIILGGVGPALRVHAGQDADGEPHLVRDVDPQSGILAQVLLTSEVVILEERIRPAGRARARRYSTLYVPLGTPECFAVLLMDFEGLSALSHFQRNLSQVQGVVTARLGALLAREEGRMRMERLQALSRELSRVGSLPFKERSERVAKAFMELCGAAAVAVSRERGKTPPVWCGVENLSECDPQQLWNEYSARIEDGESVRLRGFESAGAPVNNWLVVLEAEQRVLIAFDRKPRNPLEERGFTEEDADMAALLLGTLPSQETMQQEELQAVASQGVAPKVQGEEHDITANRLLLREALERELQRAQRYHVGFSLTCFQVDAPEAKPGLYEQLREMVLQSARATDCVLFIAQGRFAVLAPEEARGQRRLARRYRYLIEKLLAELGGAGADLRIDHARYPHDAETSDEILLEAQKALGPVVD